jgi:acyl carrier protein
MSAPAVTATFAQVAALVRATLSLPETAAVEPGQLLFHDLAFTSMDLLDLLFRLEDHFGIAVTEATVTRLARGDLDEAAFAQQGVLTPAGRARLMVLLDDTPPAMFPEEIDAAGLPRYCTAGAIARVVDHLLAERQAACSS